MLDQHLRWNEHIIYIKKKIRLFTHTFFMLRDILHKKNLITIYKILVESIIRYCIIVIWGRLYNILTLLQTAQNSLLKIILRKNKLYNTMLLYNKSDTLNIRNLFTYYCLLYMFNKSDHPNHVTLYDTRFSEKRLVEISLFKKSHSQRFVFYLGPKLFNLLPQAVTVKVYKKLNIYKTELKKFVKHNQESIKDILK